MNSESNLQDYEKLHSELRQTLASVRVWRTVSLISIMAVAGSWIGMAIVAVILLPALADNAVRARLAENDAIESMQRISEAVILAEQGATFADLSARRAEQSQQAARGITATSITLDRGPDRSASVDEILATLLEVARSYLADNPESDLNVDLRQRVDAQLKVLDTQSTEAGASGS